ncbi:MAG: EAL domain-containing protein [Cytophagaceae bacterium]|nr:EAL domain-containing protein [Gemmatimonadaceae bacterium]
MSGGLADVRYSYAFQPIVDINAQAIWSYEALIRGTRGEGAGSVYARVDRLDLHEFDRQSRGVAIEIAGRLGVACSLNLNALPGSLADGTAGVERTVASALAAGLSVDQLVLEVTESEVIEDAVVLCERLNAYRAAGIRIAIDDFGAGYAGLNLLADLQPDVLKLDMTLVRGIDGRGARQSIVRAILQVSLDLGIDVVAEGVETMREYEWLAELGLVLFQGYLIAKPAFESLPAIMLPRVQAAR